MPRAPRHDHARPWSRHSARKPTLGAVRSAYLDETCCDGMQKRVDFPRPGARTGNLRSPPRPEPYPGRMGDPSGGVIFTHAFYYLFMARSARDLAAQAIEKDPEVWPPETIIAILMSALATEAFINELAR